MNINIDLGEKFGERARDYYVDQYLDENNSNLERAANFGAGMFASLWTCDTSNDTFDTLLAAWGLAKPAANLTGDKIKTGIDNLRNSFDDVWKGLIGKDGLNDFLNSDLLEFSGRRNQVYTPDLSNVTGKGANARQRAIDSILKEDFSNLNLTHKPEYSPHINTGVAKQNNGTQIGKNMFSSRNDLRNTIVHEELHHRWWKRGLKDHHPLGSAKEKRFYKTVDRYMKMRGWK